MVAPRTALQILLELTRALLGGGSLQEALELVTEAALALLPGDHASIRVLDRTRTELLSGARSGTGAEVEPARRLRGSGISGWVVEHGEPALVGDAAADPRFEPTPDQGFVVGSIVAVPLWSSGEVIGVLSVSAPNAGAFGTDDLALASLLANCAVPSIEKARLARLAVTDPRTMAFNASFLLPGLEQQMQRCRRSGDPLALLLIDLDEFKKVNDRHGHAAGDAVLEEFARRLRAVTRERDLVVRRGGDEFVLIMPSATEATALRVAARIRSEMADHPIPLGDGLRHVQTVSIGVAAWDGSEPPETLERRADVAMYAAKAGGRDAITLA